MKGVAVSICVALLFSSFLATISLVTDLASIEKYMPYIIIGATICSVFIGSVYATQQCGGKGLLIGVGIGIAYVLFAAVFEIKVCGEILTAIAFCKKMVMTSVAGALGGIVGTNL
jgi:putative membrane protein (TIGR04086 family)